MSIDETSVRQEAAVFGRYLLHETPNEQAVQHYVHALRVTPGSSDAADRKLLHFAHRHPHLLGTLDAGLALTRPHAELRRRLYLLFAILEATPQYADRFLPTARRPWYIIYIVWVGGRAAVKGLLGSVLVKLLV